jgi:hypothetical protein
LAVDDDRGAAELDQLDRRGDTGSYRHALGCQYAPDGMPRRIGVRFGVDAPRHHRRKVT